MNLSDWIERWAAFAASKVCLRYEGADLTYADLSCRIGRIARVLSVDLGVRRGDRVAWLGMNNSESLAVLFACARLGAIYVPVNWRLICAELLPLIHDAEPIILLAEPQFAEALEESAISLTGPRLACTGGIRRGWLDWDAMVQNAAIREDAEGCYDNPVLLCYTSGTTGQAKGAVHTQEGLLWNAVNSTHMHDLTSEDRVLATLPMFHVGGLNVQTLPALHAGATVTLHRRFEPVAALASLQSDRITLAVFVPTMLDSLLAQPTWNTADLSGLRCITTGSTIVSPALIRKVQARGVPVIQVYGATETGPVSVFQRRCDAAHAGAVGRCGLHVELRLVNDLGDEVAPGASGEILIRGRNVMSGYWRDPAGTATALKDGWFYTGDIGHFDSDGYLRVDERKKDMIISGGEKIFPAALEAILADCADIAEAAVVPSVDQHWGEIPVAVVVRKPGSRISSEDVLGLFRGRVAHYKHPRAVVFAQTLPRNGMGKLARKEIRDMVRQVPPQAKTAGQGA